MKNLLIFSDFRGCPPVYCLSVAPCDPECVVFIINEGGAKCNFKGRNLLSLLLALDTGIFDDRDYLFFTDTIPVYFHSRFYW